MSVIANFIDAGHLDKRAYAAIGTVRIDHRELVRRMAFGCDVLRTLYYDCLPFLGARPSADEERHFYSKRSFFAALARMPGFAVRLGRLAYRGRDVDGRPVYEQKRVDVSLAVDLARLALRGEITHATLLAGDSDLIPAVELARQEGVVVHLFHGPDAHRDLVAACDERVELTPQFLASVRRDRHAASPVLGRVA